MKYILCIVPDVVLQSPERACKRPKEITEKIDAIEITEKDSFPSQNEHKRNNFGNIEAINTIRKASCGRI